MAEMFHVLMDAKHAGIAFPGVGDGIKEFSKTESEELGAVVGGSSTPARFGTEAISIFGPIQTAKIVTVKASSAANAAKLCKYFLGLPVAGVVPAAESPITNKEAGEKPVQTVKTTEYANTAAT